MKIVPEIRRGH